MTTFLTRLPHLRLSLCVAVLVAVFAAAQNSGAKIDTDQDGLPDKQEKYWGTDPTVPDLPAVIYTFPERDATSRAKPGYDPALDPKELAVTHIAEDRYLWRVTFAADVNPDDCILHLYLDSDGNQATGRQSGGLVNGTDQMISFSGSAPRIQVYPPDGSAPTLATPPYHYVDGKYL
ncbi:MAG TPA: thrombospondin type 3 repeat-containing protein, partial [Lentisphaeria bacterium]|nr:thrombospondin type 3 repeat-containing protein [Lentisphaeria bacterium]